MNLRYCLKLSIASQFFKFEFYLLEVLQNGCPYVCTYIGSPLVNSSEMTGNSQAISLQDIGGYWQPSDLCVIEAFHCFLYIFNTAQQLCNDLTWKIQGF